MDSEISDYNYRSRSSSPANTSSDGDVLPPSRPRRGRGRGGRGRGCRGRDERGGRGRGGRGRGERGSSGRGVRGRGERGGRGRGRGGRSAPAVGPNRAEAAIRYTQEREENLVTIVNTMDLEGTRSLLLRICRRQPSMILDLIEVEDGPPGPIPCTSQPSWCVCGNCKEMPPEEQVCCNRQPRNCFSTLPDFHTIVLDELVLEVAMRYRNDFLAQPVDQDYNRARRHAAYRQYILWIHGHLGAGNRRVIPSCCVWKIRDKYPDPHGRYVGFVAGRLG